MVLKRQFRIQGDKASLVWQRADRSVVRPRAHESDRRIEVRYPADLRQCAWKQQCIGIEQENIVVTGESLGKSTIDTANKTQIPLVNEYLSTGRFAQLLYRGIQR